MGNFSCKCGLFDSTRVWWSDGISHNKYLDNVCPPCSDSGHDSNTIDSERFSSSHENLRMFSGSVHCPVSCRSVHTSNGNMERWNEVGHAENCRTRITEPYTPAVHLRLSWLKIPVQGLNLDYSKCPFADQVPEIAKNPEQQIMYDAVFELKIIKFLLCKQSKNFHEIRTGFIITVCVASNSKSAVRIDFVIWSGSRNNENRLK